MGKAKIISGGPTGLYEIILVTDTSKITSQIAAITARLGALNIAIPAALASKNRMQGARDDANSNLNDSISKLVLKQITEGEVNSAHSAYIKALETYSTYDTAYLLLLQEKESKTQQKTMLQQALTPDDRNAWCADLTENLDANEEVGTIEVNGEYKHIIIYPGGDWDNLPESLLQLTQASTPAGVFYNWARYAGWQRWKPTYRVGTITGISGDICSVCLDPAQSMVQKLNINQITGGGILTNVPINYMDGLNGDVFETGDRVVVEFADQDWSKPSVIGFESHPKGLGRYTGNFYAFYNDKADLTGNFTAACLTWDQSITLRNTKTYDKIRMGANNLSNLVTFHAKRFTHNVPTNGVVTPRDLYLIVTTLGINLTPYPGWTTFAAANPAWPLVTNNGNTQIAMTDKVLADITAVNVNVNNGHTKLAIADLWKIMAANESGDCISFALTKAQKLLDLGYPASALHIECGYPDVATTDPAPAVGHAWLVVQTTEGDYALDINSDTVDKNKNLKLAAQKLILRRRQIGMNWAFMSPYSWMEFSQNGAYNQPAYYILDPLLNVMYYLGSSDVLFAVLGAGNHFNFSSDNNYIYAGWGNRYQVMENNIVISGWPVCNNQQFLARDGQILSAPNNNINMDIVTLDGYYDCVFAPNGDGTGYKTWRYDPSVVFGKYFGNPFIYYNAYYVDASNNGPYYLKTPWEETSSSGYGYFMANFATADKFIQGFALANSLDLPRSIRLYNNGLPILPKILTFLGITDQQFLGFAFVPGTDRLNN